MLHIKSPTRKRKCRALRVISLVWPQKQNHIVDSVVVVASAVWLLATPDFFLCSVISFHNRVPHITKRDTFKMKSFIVVPFIFCPLAKRVALIFHRSQTQHPRGGWLQFFPRHPIRPQRHFHFVARKCLCWYDGLNYYLKYPATKRGPSETADNTFPKSCSLMEGVTMITCNSQPLQPARHQPTSASQSQNNNRHPSWRRRVADRLKFYCSRLCVVCVSTLSSSSIISMLWSKAMAVFLA